MNHSNPDSHANHNHHNHNHEDHYSAKKLPQMISFVCAAPAARQVTLVGDFNDWHPESFPMKRHTDGTWLLQIPLGRGDHHYQFLVDGKPVLDPKALGVARDESDQKVSLLQVI